MCFVAQSIIHRSSMISHSDCLRMNIMYNLYVSMYLCTHVCVCVCVCVCACVRVCVRACAYPELATKARCAYCHVEKYVSQMKRVEASTLVNTSWGHRGICFCRQRCRYNFISAYPQVEFLNLSFSDLLDGGIRENAPKLPRNISHMVQNTGNSSAVDKFTYKPAPEEAKGKSKMQHLVVCCTSCVVLLWKEGFFDKL